MSGVRLLLNVYGVYALTPQPPDGATAALTPFVWLNTSPQFPHEFPYAKTRVCGVVLAKSVCVCVRCFFCVIRGFANVLSYGVARIVLAPKFQTVLFMLPITTTQKHFLGHNTKASALFFFFTQQRTVCLHAMNSHKQVSMVG